MNIVGQGRRVRIYTGETVQWGWKPLFLAVLEFLRAEGAAGVTVQRGVAGFGATSRIHTAKMLRLSEDLPLMIDWIDTPWPPSTPATAASTPGRSATSSAR